MKVRVSNGNGKKYLHNLTHEVNTTSSWGFVQPLMVNERVPDDVITLRTGQNIFLAPLSKPTFGRVISKTYHTFVPTHDIWHPFDSFLSGQTYAGANAKYVPGIVPNVTQSFLYGLLMFQSSIHAYACTTNIQAGGDIGYSDLAQVAEAKEVECEQQFYTELEECTGVIKGASGFSELPTPTMTFPEVALDQDIHYEESDFILLSRGYVYFVYLNKLGRDIRKVCLGCGYQLNFESSKVSLLPLFAYFKAYFDLFQPPRSKTWKETNAFNFMETIEQSNYADFDSWSARATLIDVFIKFFFGLGSCFYTQNPDYVSAHITGASLPIATQGTNNVAYLSASGTNTTSVGVNSGAQPSVPSSVANTQNQLDILRRLYYRINAATAIGGRIKAFMKSLYGASEFEEPDSHFIGSQNIRVNIELVESNAATEEAHLAEYAAKGFVDAAGKEFKYKCRSHGFVISLTCVVPETRYAQAVDPNLRHLNKYDFYTNEFDSITLLPSPKYCVYGNQEVFGTYVNSSYGDGFGNVPNYMEYKTKYNILNGDMSLGSKRTSYLPFTLDKLLPFRNLSETSAGYVTTMNLQPSLLVAGDIWRYIGKNAWLGWFNRIFINSGNASDNVSGPRSSTVYDDIDDNFIVYNYMDYTVSSQALPVADSWQTGELGDNTMEIEKA